MGNPFSKGYPYVRIHGVGMWATRFPGLSTYPRFELAFIRFVLILCQQMPRLFLPRQKVMLPCIAPAAQPVGPEPGFFGHPGVFPRDAYLRRADGGQPAFFQMDADSHTICASHCRVCLHNERDCHFRIRSMLNNVHWLEWHRVSARRVSHQPVTHLDGQAEM